MASNEITGDHKHLSKWITLSTASPIKENNKNIDPFSLIFL
jgi:hypothetical protein